jgi:hypothetical protein
MIEKALFRMGFQELRAMIHVIVAMGGGRDMLPKGGGRGHVISRKSSSERASMDEI